MTFHSVITMVTCIIACLFWWSKLILWRLDVLCLDWLYIHVLGLCCWVYPLCVVLFTHTNIYYLINKRFSCYAAALISVQEHRTDKPIYTKPHIKLQLFNNPKIGRELGVHMHPLPRGYVQPVGHTRAVACHVLDSGGGTDL